MADVCKEFRDFEKEREEMELTEIRELYRNRKEYIGKKITVGGWIRSIRDSRTFGFSGALEREEKDARYQERRRDLIDNMVKHGHEKAKSKDDIRMLCDYFFSMSKIENEMMMVEKIQAQRKLKFLEMENINYYYLTSLPLIFPHRYQANV